MNITYVTKDDAHIAERLGLLPQIRSVNTGVSKVAMQLWVALNDRDCAQYTIEGLEYSDYVKACHA